MQSKLNTNNLQMRMKENEGTQKTNNSKLKDFISPEFISKYSNFTNIEHLFNESNFKIESEKDIENILNDELNNFIFHNTLFESWKEMKLTAIAFCHEK